MTYKTSHFVLGENEPDTEPQRSLSDIVFMVKARLSDALDNPETGLVEVHPRTLISMVVSNILVNLLVTAIGSTDMKLRMKMAQDCLEDVNAMSLHLWTALEANKVDNTTAH
jgi:hypothetical protein